MYFDFWQKTQESNLSKMLGKIQNKSFFPLTPEEMIFSEDDLRSELDQLLSEIGGEWQTTHEGGAYVEAHFEIAKGELLRLSLIDRKILSVHFDSKPFGRGYQVNASGLDAVLSEMQKKRIHVALVRNTEGVWTGFLTLEDVIEEIIGTIRDEFEDEEQVVLSDIIDERHVQLDVEANDTVEAVRLALQRISPWNLPVSCEQVIKAIDERERAVETYLGNGLGMPHARMVGIQRSVVFFIRSDKGIPYRGNQERAYLLFLLLTPAGQPRIHQRLQSVIATIMDESEFIPDHLRSAETPAEIVEILKTGEQATLD